jgi:predicted DNA-binding transcriptional regulator AlpA
MYSDSDNSTGVVARSAGDDAYLTSARVKRRYGVSEMTLWRWLRDNGLGFPKPIYIGERRYWRLADLHQFDAACAARTRARHEGVA